MEGLISVIVPVYNVQDYLEECVRSLMAQTYRLLEIILVDDGSTDDSGRMCDTYARQDERIRVIHRKNGGLSEARNTGIEACRGEYIAFVDADDVVAEIFMEELYKALTDSGADIAACAYVRRVSGPFPNNIGPKNIAKKLFDTETMLRSWHGRYKHYETVAWNKLYKRELFREIRFPIGRRHEDVLTTHLVVAEADTIVLTNQVLYLYRSRPDSVTTSRINRMYVEHNLSAQRERMAYFRKRGYRMAYLRLLKGYWLHKVWFLWKH